MKSVVTPFVFDITTFVRDALKSSTPGRRYWYEDSSHPRGIIHTKTPSTFPDWSKFLFEKRSKGGYWLNRTKVYRVLDKIERSQPLTPIQAEVAQGIAEAVFHENKDWLQLYGEETLKPSTYPF